MTPTEKLRSLLDERGIEYTICMPWNDTAWEHDGTHFTAMERFGKIYLQTSQWPLTPEQAIAATVGAQGGTIDMDWVRDLVERHSDYIEGNGRAFHNGAYERMAEEIAAMVGETVFDSEGNAVGWVTEASKPSCAACPEMGNPDSYVNHLQAALRWHDEHVPRPTNPKATCVVLQGKNPPEEVMFVREDGGGVTHYIPEDATVGTGTCKLVDNDSGPDMHCTACGGEVDDEYRYFMDSWGYSRCPHCGARIIEEETE